MARAAKKTEEKTVSVKAEEVLTGGGKTLAELDPALKGETVEAPLPDMDDPAQAAEQAEMKAAYEEDEKDAEIAELRRQIEEMRQMLSGMQAPRVVQVTADTEKVTLRFQSERADENVASFGPGGIYGQVTGKTGTLLVPKTEWSRFLTNPVRHLLATRELIVLSGLTEDEMDLYGVNYKEGELLDRKAFTKLLDLGEGLLDIFPRLCESHQQMVAKRFLDAYLKGDPRAQDRGLIVKLNDLSKSGGKKGMFSSIIRDMNRMDEAEDEESEG